MQVQILKSKIHRARVTGGNLNYEGSLTIDRALMEKAGLLLYEKILASNLANGHRFETYVIPGEAGSGAIILNGATSHLGKVGRPADHHEFRLDGSRAKPNDGIPASSSSAKGTRSSTNADCENALFNLMFTAAQLAQELDGEVLGDGSVILTGFAPAVTAKAGDLTFAENEVFFAKAEQSAAAAILVDGPFTSARKVLIRVPNARIAFARVLPLFFPEKKFPAGVHATAVIAPSAQD